MEIINYKTSIFIVLGMFIQENFTKEVDMENITIELDKISNPLANLIRNENEIGDVSRNGDHTKDALPRVKRQSYYDYDPYYRRRRPPIIVPILFGGGGFIGGRGYGGRGFGGRGFGGRGFGGRGFGGRGFGGRGFGGRGFGGRGIGGRGFGGRGGFGGGRGGRG
ncbi:unnamed protein product [Arctia plantaginis]|uniref:Uncharacterized protein n=1 Tax=Arctia plantaginis TaxID=874455 RepID=A0A8S0Z0T7_ARCPL|nr:unnamed protein product [Arctia plantaginis]